MRSNTIIAALALGLGWQACALAQTPANFIVHSAGVTWHGDTANRMNIAALDAIGTPGVDIVGHGLMRIFRSHTAPNAGVMVHGNSGWYPIMVVLLDTNASADTAHFGRYLYEELMFLVAAGCIRMTPEKCAQIRDEYPAVGGGGYYYIMHLPDPADTGLTAFDGGGAIDTALLSPPAQVLNLPTSVLAPARHVQTPPTGELARVGMWDLCGRRCDLGRREWRTQGVTAGSARGEVLLLRVTPSGR